MTAMGINILIKQPTWQFVCGHPARFLAFGFGSGLSRIMPGTAGTAASIPIYVALSYLPLPLYIVSVLAAFFIGIYFCHKASHDLGVHDHGGIVWDEFVGFWITMVAVPMTAVNVLAGFILFRIFDMVKPWPISFVDKKVHGGLGIMVDDVLAGIAAAIVLHIGLMFFA